MVLQTFCKICIVLPYFEITIIERHYITHNIAALKKVFIKMTYGIKIRRIFIFVRLFQVFQYKKQPE
ncbi:hypothetical protein BscR1v2_007010 [Bartonella schoenbuchensis R1]|uniref:Uncharacterized protein n=2 Tax=Bartonella schoenbuchensis TaxID=165694 RepID=E6YZ87_BARSR|nr:hypothetical protein BscR1v2_007010 [Bartonella schoenbuchensis R1]CBI82175.1 hypothetical protein B11C_40030 [Bartonella schoenbuchensis R1]CDP80065.1 hypothetical protein BN1046_00978 [Bartonella schoenbuchensis]